MCGICGFTGHTNKTILQRMTDVLIHRGPDEAGFYTDGHINLGIRRLSIIDVETGHQPIHDEDQNLWMICNGEIYNSLELREDLLDKGHTFYTNHADTEVIVHLYEEEGEEFIHQLNGMFAIALWDKREEKLLLIRDRMGVKPLFYAIINGNILFGSEIKAILAHPAYQRDIHYEAVYHYLSFKHVPAPLTVFQGISCLLPGQLLIYQHGQIQKKRYWKVRFNETSPYDDQEIREALLTLLEEAVRLRMRCDVPFGAYLSGGVDSSSVVALMTQFTSTPLKTFALGYRDSFMHKEADRYYAKQVAHMYHTDHYEYLMSHQKLVDDIGKVIEAFDQPFSGAVSTYFLTKLIAQHVNVALSGDGADELFGSYLSHRIAQPMYHFTRLYNRVKCNALTEEDRELLKPCELNFLHDLFRKSGGDERRWRYQLYLFSDEEKGNLLSDNFKRTVQHTSTCSLIQDYFEAVTSNDPLNRILEMEWNTQLPDQVLAFVDRLSMAHSVEIRSPFLDYQLVEFVATIPGNLKIWHGNVKDILKKTVAPFLPEEITQRPKEGFVLPVFEWLPEKLKTYSQDLLSEQRLRQHCLLNTTEVNNLVHAYYAGAKTYAGKLWNLMMFQVWWEKYFG